MVINEKHVGAEGGGEMVPVLHRQRGLPEGGPSQEGRGGESKDPFHHRHPQGAPCAGATSGRESPKVFGMGEGITPIPTSGGHWGDPPTNKGLKAKGRI